MEKKRSESFPSLCVSPRTEASPTFTVNQHLSFDGVRKSLSDLKKRVEEMYFCYLTLDPNTVHHQLILSEKNRAVTRGRKDKPYSDLPERFDSRSQVLCKESVSGRCYWEVEWSGIGVDISVSYKEIIRKGGAKECGFGCTSQSWSLQCYSSSLCFWHNIKTDLGIPVSSRIGVYVHHSAGTLSFYSVSDTMKLLHRVHITFT
ncbi:tripartite motif-containing protein 16-like [Ictalurus furcatus]|uniref:tripartite motif-containing protein 16-like n=1 Tax=Ictalurus furcatus TaxID=66913 RepID=UPI00235021E8|nr:tripartite motif-containing protein 16-like [Ictalurus furcatus]